VSVSVDERKTLLRFIACGSVDDGKSTLMGRLLYESNGVFDDQLAVLANESRRVGTRGGDLDFALLLDGLCAEREQGITIDVAYRFFSTATRKFIVADTPGHEQYTRNMVTGASTAELAVVLVDARKGVLPQTRRHSYLVSLLGIRQIVLAINKMDLVDYSRVTFERIEGAYRAFAAHVGLTDVTCIPLSAVQGDNVVRRGERMPWYTGPTLLEQLHRSPAGSGLAVKPFRLPVQWVNRPNSEFRGLAGLIVSGRVRVDDPIRVLPAGLQTRVAEILDGDRPVESAGAGQSVTLVLADEIDVSRGDVLAAASAPPQAAEQFEATVIWMHDEPMLPGRSYLVKLGTRTVAGTIAPIKYRIDIDTLAHVDAARLDLNDIARCNVVLDQPVVFEPYQENRDLGGFIVIDRLTNNTVGAGLLHFAVRGSHDVTWETLEVSRQARARLKGQQPRVLWLTGLPAAGKTTIAKLLDKQLHWLGRHTYVLDGDNLRHGLNKDLGFTEADRVENVRRVAEVARVMADAGLIVMVSFISPFRAERRMARRLMAQGEFVEIFVDAPLDVAEARDPKGLYKRARRGELRNFTGIDSPYQPPEHPEIHLETATLTPERAVQIILEYLQRTGALDAT
jgi:bifunctional enzyme CysN/CysC